MEIDPENFWIPESKVEGYGLLCEKPVYGLNDAPLAWQLCLHEFAEEQNGIASSLDENMIIWKGDKHIKRLENGQTVTPMATTHVDDIALSALNNLYVLFVKRFKKVTRNRLPFEHCECAITQREFCKKMPLAPVPARAPESKLLPKEITDLKPALGALQWLTATRLDIISDVSVAKTGEVKHVQQVNKVIKQAQSVNNQNLGLHYRRFHASVNAYSRYTMPHRRRRDDAMRKKESWFCLWTTFGTAEGYHHIRSARKKRQFVMVESDTYYMFMVARPNAFRIARAAQKRSVQ